MLTKSCLETWNCHPNQLLDFESIENLIKIIISIGLINWTFCMSCWHRLLCGGITLVDREDLQSCNIIAWLYSCLAGLKYLNCFGSNCLSFYRGCTVWVNKTKKQNCELGVTRVVKQSFDDMALVSYDSLIFPAMTPENVQRNEWSEFYRKLRITATMIIHRTVLLL